MPLVTVFVVLGWIFALCLHEWGHAIIAYKGGDVSVKYKGYLTFNPLKYTDPMFSIILPIIFLALGGIGLPGGAVYINTRALKSPLWATGVSLAGPAMTLIGAFIFSLPFLLGFARGNELTPIMSALAFLTFLQCFAFVVNLIPIPPLDGYRAISPWLPPSIRQFCDQYAFFGTLIIFFVLFQLPFFANLIWIFAYIICMIFGVPEQAITQGYILFKFWENPN